MSRLDAVGIPAFQGGEDVNEVDGEPERAIEATASWCEKLLGLLSPHGVVVTNFTTPDERRASAFKAQGAWLRQQGLCCRSLSVPRYANVVTAVSRQALSVARLKAGLSQWASALPQCRVNADHFDIESR